MGFFKKAARGPKPFDGCGSVDIALESKPGMKFSSKTMDTNARLVKCARTVLDSDSVTQLPETNLDEYWNNNEAAHKMKVRNQLSELAQATICSGCPYVGLTIDQARLIKAELRREIAVANQEAASAELTAALAAEELRKHDPRTALERAEQAISNKG